MAAFLSMQTKPVDYQQTREKVGKRPEDEMTGAQGGLPPWLLQLQTPVDYQKTISRPTGSVT